jgi:succinate dehydrogenase subunit D
MTKRSSQPAFWLLFGAGGMLSALVGAALVFVTGIAAPLGLEPPAAMGYADALAFSRNWGGKAFLFLVISLFLWHGVHRIYHTAHDLGLPTGLVAKVACYGTALFGTIAAAEALLKLGF